MGEGGLVYLDHAATTPVRQEVLEAMLPYFSGLYGNPSSLYPLAQRSRDGIQAARSSVARVLNCRLDEIIFTSGGTESDNSAIKGVVFGAQRPAKELVTTPIEHHAVLNTCRDLSINHGILVHQVGVDAYGQVDPLEIARLITERTVLVSVMYANNEIGTVSPVAEISRAVRERAQRLGHPIWIHTDAVQAPGYLDLDVQKLGVDLLSLSAHKFHGPKGTGVLYVRRGTPFCPLILGGGQENDRRSGTQNVPGIVGVGLALELAERERPEVSARCKGLRDAIIAGVLQMGCEARLNGHPTERLPNNANFSIPKVDGDALVLGLASEGIAASTGSACSTGAQEPSHVLLAIGVDREAAWGSLRLTLGRDSTQRDVHRTLEVLPRIIGRARSG